MIKFNEFYRLTAPLKRLAKLKELMEMEPAPEGLDYAKTLFFKRYDEKDEKLSVDRFLYNCMMLMSYDKNSIFFKSKERKEILKMMKAMGVETASTEIEKELLHYELKNVALRYFETCNSSKYKKKIFGLMESSDTEKRNYMASDAQKMSVLLAEKYGIEKEMAPWVEAVQEAFEEVSAKFNDY